MDLLSGDRQVRLMQKLVEELEVNQRELREQVRATNGRLDLIKQQLAKGDEIHGRLRDLLLLCHPDKHSNSEKSGEITRWLLAVRDEHNA